MNSTLFNFVLFPNTVEAIPSIDDNSSPMNRQTQASSVLDLVTQTTLSTHPTECRVHGFPGLDHAGRYQLSRHWIYKTLPPLSRRNMVHRLATVLSIRRRSQIHGSATLDILIRGTGLSQCVVDGTTATLIEDILHITSRFLDVLGSIAGHSRSRRMTNIALSTDSSLAPNREPNPRALRVHAGSSASRLRPQQMKANRH
jgi:hypothetical protein